VAEARKAFALRLPVPTTAAAPPIFRGETTDRDGDDVELLENE
jgi:hypothetical protein